MGQMEDGLTRLNAALGGVERALHALLAAPERIATGRMNAARARVGEDVADALARAEGALRAALDAGDATLASETPDTDASS